MGKGDEEVQSLRTNVGNAGSSDQNERPRFFRCGWISGFVSLRCVLVLVFSAALFLSALFWLPPFDRLEDRGSLDPDSVFKDHEIVASFKVENSVSLLESNLLQLEKDIFDEISYIGTKVVVLSLETLGRSNITKVVFAVDSDRKNAKIPQEFQSLIKATFESFIINQVSLQLTSSLFGEPFLFEVLKFPGGITVAPLQRAFLLSNVQILFNFTLNYSISEIQTNFEEFSGQLKRGLYLAPYENLYVSLSNSKGSTVVPPSKIHASVLPMVGNAPSQPRLKQLAQTITGSHSKNLGLNNTVFGSVKQVRLSSLLQHSLHGGVKPPSPAPQPHHHHHHRHHHHHHPHHHHRHHHLHHHHRHNDYPNPEFAPESSPRNSPDANRGRVAPAPAPARSYSASSPNPPSDKRKTGKTSLGKQHSFAPSVATPGSESNLNPPSSPFPNVVFAHAQPPSKSQAETQHVYGTPSASPSQSQSSAGGPTKHWEFLVVIAAAIVCL